MEMPKALAGEDFELMDTTGLEPVTPTMSRKAANSSKFY
jgi:hypothetical protein